MSAVRGFLALAFVPAHLFAWHGPVLASHTPAPGAVTVAGNLQSELGCPGDWMPECSATQLAYDATEGIWQATFDVPAGTWEYKAALDRSWTENYGGNATRYRFSLSGGSGGAAWSVEAEPIWPGISGAATLLVAVTPDRADIVASVPTPGAEAARQAMMDDLFADAYQAMAELLGLERAAATQPLSFLAARSTLEQVVGVLDRDGDGRLAAFLDKASRRMKLHAMDALSAESAAIPTIVVVNGGGNTPQLHDLCRLTRLFSADDKVAESLCRTLRLAEAAIARGDASLGERHLAQYRAEVEAQVHRAFTRADATTLANVFAVWLATG